MADLERLLNDLANLDAQHDLEGMRATRAAIVEHFPESEAAVEALYKLGLDNLFRQRNVTAAANAFEEAARRKHPYWSAAARTSLGLCLYHQKRLQKALFELRKVAYPEKPTPHSVTALSFLESIFQAEGQPEEVKRVRRERATQLDKLIAENRAAHGSAAERGHYLHLLALVRRDLGETAEAHAALQDAKKLGPEKLGADLYRAIIEALG